LRTIESPRAKQWHNALAHYKAPICSCVIAVALAITAIVLAIFISAPIAVAIGGAAVEIILLSSQNAHHNAEIALYRKTDAQKQQEINDLEAALALSQPLEPALSATEEKPPLCSQAPQETVAQADIERLQAAVKESEKRVLLYERRDTEQQRKIKDLEEALALNQPLEPPLSASEEKTSSSSQAPQRAAAPLPENRKEGSSQPINCEQIEGASSQVDLPPQQQFLSPRQKLRKLISDLISEIIISYEDSAEKSSPVIPLSDAMKRRVFSIIPLALQDKETMQSLHLLRKKAIWRILKPVLTLILNEKLKERPESLKKAQEKLSLQRAKAEESKKKRGVSGNGASTSSQQLEQKNKLLKELGEEVKREQEALKQQDALLRHLETDVLSEIVKALHLNPQKEAKLKDYLARKEWISLIESIIDSAVSG
jgi:hypothetical protein